MTELLDSAGLRLAGYVVVAMAALVSGRREQRSTSSPSEGCWPAFWYLSALLLAVMAASRAVDIGDVVSDVGRDRIRSGGWYDIRRAFQALIVGTVAGVWAVSVLVSTWRVPARHRRFLPAAVMLGTLAGFAAVRVVSFHYVDTVLYRRDLFGVRVVAIVELALLALTFATMFWFPLVRRGDPEDRTPSTPSP